MLRGSKCSKKCLHSVLNEERSSIAPAGQRSKLEQDEHGRRRWRRVFFSISAFQPLHQNPTATLGQRPDVRLLPSPNACFPLGQRPTARLGQGPIARLVPLWRGSGRGRGRETRSHIGLICRANLRTRQSRERDRETHQRGRASCAAPDHARHGKEKAALDPTISSEARRRVRV